MVKKSLRNFLFLFFLLSFSSPCWAQGTDVPGSRDPAFISRYAGSVILGYDVRDFDSLAMLLGRQVSDPKTGTPSAAKSQNLEGKVTRILYVSPEERSTLEVLRNYQQSLTKAGFEILFTCAQTQCGDRLHMVLYPLERRLKNSGQISEYALEFPKDQRYLAAKASRPEGDLYVSLYVAICGINNFKETFNHPVTLMETVETKPMETGKVTVTAEALAKDLQAAGHVAVYGIFFDTDKADIKAESESTLKEMARLLHTNPGLKVYIVGHTDTQGALGYNIELSQRRADALSQALVQRFGIDPKRLATKGVGPLAPVASNDQEAGRAKNRRVELVKQ
jgi:OmpA-OmpF porin, OOP family